MVNTKVQTLFFCQPTQEVRSDWGLFVDVSRWFPQVPGDHWLP